MSKTDFPYYNGQPVEIAPMGWLAILVSVGVALGLLITLPFPNFPLNLLPAIAYTGLPLLTLALVTRGHHTALFARFGLKQLGQALGFGLLTIAVSLGVGLILLQFTAMTANPSVAALSHMTGIDMVLFMLRTFIQLIGEELMTILPLLAVLWLCLRKFNTSRRIGLVIAVLVSTVWFAAVHLPTYNWNLLQCLGGIGAARLVLTTAFLVTRNLWVSAGAHIANDWTEFLAPMLLGGHLPVDTAG